MATVAVLADDLIWGTRLATTIDALGGFRATRVRTLADLDAWLAAPDRGVVADAVIVDLTARAYDGVAAIAAAVARGVRTLAVGQHDDLALRRRALAAGAERVYAYRKLFEDGPATLGRWLGATAADAPGAAS
ncbi:MAG: hypothetical protein L0221_01290 [Chloroflexi bacterium]|nr:hypothetical protein [Chloroflexota bacterium]